MKIINELEGKVAYMVIEQYFGENDKNNLDFEEFTKFVVDNLDLDLGLTSNISLIHLCVNRAVSNHHINFIKFVMNNLDFDVINKVGGELERCFDKSSYNDLLRYDFNQKLVKQERLYLDRILELEMKLNFHVIEEAIGPVKGTIHKI